MNPKDYMILEVSNGKPRVTTLPQALDITSKEELRAQLRHWSKGHGPMFLRNLLPKADSTRANQKVALNYFQKVRPALRAYCTKYGVKIPKWLSIDTQYTSMQDSEKLALFGTTKLVTREFKPLKMPQNAAKKASSHATDK